MVSFIFFGRLGSPLRGPRELLSGTSMDLRLGVASPFNRRSQSPRVARGLFPCPGFCASPKEVSHFFLPPSVGTLIMAPFWLLSTQGLGPSSTRGEGRCEIDDCRLSFANTFSSEIEC